MPHDTDSPLAPPAPTQHTEPGRPAARSRPPHLRAVATLFVLVLVLFSAERLFLWASLREQFSPASGADILRAFAVGLRFDLAVASLLSLVFVLVLLVAPLRWRPTAALVAGCWASLLALALLGSLCDVFFYRQFATHLDHKVWQYLPHRATLSLLFSDTPLPWALLGVALASGVAYRACRRWFVPRPPRPASLLSRLGLVLCIPLLAWGVRGNASPIHMTSAEAYAGASLSTAQLTLNGLYTLLQSGIERLVDARLAELTPIGRSDSEALAEAGARLASQAAGPVPGGPNPLWHHTRSDRPARPAHVVLVILESLDGRYPASMGGSGQLTPRLDALARDGLLMDQCFAVGSRTAYGLAGVLASFPDLAAQSVVSRSTSEGHMTTLGSILQRRGYRTLFLHGGQPSFDNLRGFAASNGFDETVFEDDFATGVLAADYGWCDEDLYAETLRRLDAGDERPFLAVLMTLSFHRPYAVPEGRVEPVLTPEGDVDRHLTSGRYADWALGRFLDQARQRPWFDDTIFVVVADHTDDQGRAVIAPEAYRVPFVIWAPGLAEHDPDLAPGRRRSLVCSQIDVAPTILELLGGSYDSPFLGASVLHRSPDEGWAVMLRGDTAMAYIDDQRRSAVLPFRGGSPVLRSLTGPMQSEPMHDDALLEQLLQRGLGVLQAADAMYRHDLQRVPLAARVDAGP